MALHLKKWMDWVYGLRHTFEKRIYQHRVQKVLLAGVVKLYWENP